MIEQFPDKKERYETNTREFINAVDTIIKDYSLKFNSITNNTILSYHPAWIYLTSTFNLNEISIEHEGKEPNAQSLAEIVDTAKSKKLNTIFLEPQFNKAVAEGIAKEIGAEIVNIDPLPADYLKNLEDILNKMYKSLL